MQGKLATRPLGISHPFRTTPCHSNKHIRAHSLSGICAAIQLQRQLDVSATIFESEAEIGGTWATNTYPGCGSDDRSYLYSYSFAPNYDWSRKYVPQAEILEYLRNTASRFGLYTNHNVLFSHRVTRMQWDDSLQKWRLDWVNTLTNEQGVHEADVMIHGTGLYKTPRIPRAFDTFKGEKWHSARWNHSVDLTGKRVGVVGSSARYLFFYIVLQYEEWK